MNQFIKYHALGNDYFVLNSKTKTGEIPNWSPAEIERICHRNYGLGSDGILVGGWNPDSECFTLKIYNPDGSEAEKSGNGLRIFARSLWDRKWVTEEPFQIQTPGGMVRAQILDSGSAVTVEMGRVSFDSKQIPVNGPEREVLQESFTIDGQELTFCAATIGNPHCVLPMSEISETEAKQLGPLIENNPLFPNRTNVQFLKVLNQNQIQIEIWERGAGYTLASGSSSSAAACVAHKLGLCDSEIEVFMPGGKINISINENFEVVMTGSVTRIGELQLDPECQSFKEP